MVSFRLLATLALAVACAAAPADEASRALLAQGQALVRGGELVAGAEKLRGALASAPEGASALRAEIHSWLGHALQLDRDLDEALEHYGRASDLAPRDPWPRYERGVILSEIGEYEEARVALTEALELEPGHLQSRLFRAHVLRMTGELAAARVDLDRLLVDLARTDPAVIAAWGRDAAQLEREALVERVEVLDALGEREAAAADRERLGELYEP